MLKTLPVWTALLLMIGAGVWAGVHTNRWAVSDELQVAVARLQGFPLMVGDWEGQPLALDARQLEIGEISGYSTGRYVNRRTGNAVSVLVVCGLPGPISVHTPEVCYSGAGYEATAAPVKFPLPGTTTPAPEFNLANFSKQDGGPAAHLRILWSWSTDGNWRVPDKPRFSFPGSKYLYKLYVIRPMATPDEPLKDDPGVEFLQQLLPRLQQTLFTVP